MAEGKLICVTCMVEMYTYVQVSDGEDPIEIAKMVGSWRRTMNLPGVDFKVVEQSKQQGMFPSSDQQ